MTDDYRRRILDDVLDELLKGLPAVLLDGPKAVGKTSTALQRATATIRLDRDEERQVLAADVDAGLARRGSPLLVDEWHRFPPVWDAVKRAVDEDSTVGRFLLTGSAPLTGSATHSGAGRIVPVRMRPMTLSERGLADPEVSLAALLRGEVEIAECDTRLGLSDYVDAIVASGFPDIHRRPARARRELLDGYLTQLAHREVEEVTGRGVAPVTMTGWLRGYAAAVSTVTSYEKIRDAASAGLDVTPAKTTALKYVEALAALRVLDEVEAWRPSGSQLRALGQAPKHHLVDPALAARLLGLDGPAILDGRQGDLTPVHDGRALGALFESLVTLHVRVYAQAAEAQVRHLRTHGGEREIDLLVTTTDGRIVALEIKASASVGDQDVTHLRWLRDSLGDQVIATAVVTTGPRSFRRADGVLVIPLALLGP